MRFRIVCTDQEPVYQPTTHAHIVSVGTGDDPNRASKKWTLAEVVQAIDSGHEFYTIGLKTGRVAIVEKCYCGYCWKTHIRSAADSVHDNNLDSLRRCSWNT